MSIIKILGTVVALSMFFMYWAFPIQVCALDLYYFIIKKRVGRFLNPYAKHDMSMQEQCRRKCRAFCGK